MVTKMGKITDIFNGIRSLCMIPVDGYIKLEEKVSTKALVYTFGFAFPIAYMRLNAMFIPPGYGDLFYWITMMYFGGGAVKFVKGAFDGK